jgi:hypothetical protein
VEKKEIVQHETKTWVSIFIEKLYIHAFAEASGMPLLYIGSTALTVFNVPSNDI